MGWEADNHDYAREKRLNISPFRTDYYVSHFVYTMPAQLGAMSVALALRSVWLGAFMALVLVFQVSSQQFKFLWENAPWFKALIGYVTMFQIPAVILAAVFPFSWLGFVGFFVTMFAGLPYHRECDAFAREFNIPKREP
jgi:hypothetical protein